MNYLIPVLLFYFVCSFGPQARAEDNDPKVEENRELLLEKIKDDLVILDELTKDCLLYTSPSPRDQRGSRMPSSA